jgi:hypothetical protein
MNPKPYQTWREYCFEHIPDGDGCDGCEWVEEIIGYETHECGLFCETVTHGKCALCRTFKKKQGALTAPDE